MPGIRLHPNYHGYQLDNPLFAELLTIAEQRGLIVQLAVRIEDLRTQHPLMRVSDVDTRPLAKLIAARPKLRLVLLNALRSLRGNAISQLVAAGPVYFEIAMLEGVGGIANVLGRIPADRLLFGSHFPFFVLRVRLAQAQGVRAPAGSGGGYHVSQCHATGSRKLSRRISVNLQKSPKAPGLPVSPFVVSLVS